MKTLHRSGSIEGNPDVAPLYETDAMAARVQVERFRLDTFRATRRRYQAIIQPERGKPLKEMRVTVEAVSAAQARKDVDRIIAECWPGVRIKELHLTAVAVSSETNVLPIAARQGNGAALFKR